MEDMYYNKTDFYLFNNFTEFNKTSCGSSLIHPVVSRIFELLYVGICIVGLLGNTLVIYVVLRFSRFHTVTSTYILNLAVADECFLIGIPFLVTTSIYKSWPFGGAMCKIYMTTMGINQFTSSIFLTVMSADRYLAICHPVSSPDLRTKFVSKVVSISAWTLSAIMMVPIIMYSDVLEQKYQDKYVYSCNIIWPGSGNHTNSTELQKQIQLNIFTLYTFVFSFAIPLTLIFIFYVMVIRKLKTIGPKNQSYEKKKSHKKATNIVVTVIVVYVFCWLPYWVAQLVLIFHTAESEDEISCNTSGATLFLLTHLVTSILSNANSAMNPVLYAFFSEPFKKSFSKACTCAGANEINCTLHLENRGGSERLHCGQRRGTTLYQAGEEEVNDDAQLFCKGDLSTMTMTSRSNITLSTDVTTKGSNSSKEDGMKNGLRAISQPTPV